MLPAIKGGNYMQQKQIIVAIYTRVSTKEQAEEGYSLDAQERLLIDFCTAKRYDIYKIYSDEGISAKDIAHRPEMLQLLSDARERKFDLILVWKLTRFSRNMADLMTACELLDSLGISLVSYSESFDSSTPAGRMVRSMLGTVAQFEREVIGENVAFGLAERARQEKWTCTQILGYDNLGSDSLAINTTEAEYVNFVHDQYLIEKNMTEVTRLARAKGFRGKRGRLPHCSSIMLILTRPQYAGYNIFNGHLHKGDYEPIRTVAQFNKVQRLILKQGNLTGQPRKKKLYILPE